MNKHFCFYCMSPVNEDGSCPVCGLTAGAYQPAPHHIPPGTILMNRYLFGRVLGEGGFGITYIACDLRLDLKVAIKEYFPTDKATRHSAASLDVTSYTGTATNNYESCKRKFLSEARTMAKMDKQPEVVSVRDFFELNNTAYIVMEYVDGTNFRELVKQQGGKIPSQQLLTTIEPMFAALSAMHTAGLVHRDISPDNLMLEHGKVRLLDFGCARESATGTDTLTIALKHGFAPIEQYTNHGQGPWTDVYALAGTIYFCITGKAPVRSTDRLLGDELILPSKLGIDLTRQQEKALLRAMAIQPRRRFQTMEEFRAALYAPDEDPVYISSEPEPDVQNGQPDAVDICEVLSEPDPAEKTNSPSTVTAAVITEQTNQTVHKSTVLAWKNPKFFIPIIAGAVVVLALIIGLIWKGNSGSHNEYLGGNETTSVEEFIDNATNPPVNDTAQPCVLETNRDGSYVDNYQNFLNALADPEVSEIRITGDGTLEALDYVKTVISKPVYLDGSSMICYFPVEIVEGGHLVINGHFMSEGYIRTRNGGKITIEDGSSTHFMGMVWLENSSDMEDWEGNLLHRWVFNESAAAEDSVRVSSFDELRQELDTPAGHTIIIDSDMTVSLETWGVYNRSIIISPGVTVTSEANDFTVRGNLFNYGTLILNDNVDVIDQSGHLFNYGTMKVNAPEDFHISDESMLLNLGTLTTTTEAKVHVNSSLINMGQIEAKHQLNIGGTAFNSGSISVFSAEEGDISNCGNMVNWGTITTDRLDNYGYILTGGDLTANFAYNVGFLDESTYYVSPEGHTNIINIDSSRGVHSTRNQERDSPADGIVDLSNNIVSGDEQSIMHQLGVEQTVTVTTEDELVNYAYSDYDWLVVTEDITCNQDLELDQNLIILPGKTLRFADGKCLYAHGVTVSVEGYLIGGNLHFEEGSRLMVSGDDGNTVSGNLLVLSSESVCYLHHTSVNMEKLILQEGSICISYGSSISCEQQVLLEDSSRLMLADSLHSECTIDTPELLVSCSHVTNLAQQKLQNMQITLDSGHLDNCKLLTLSNCDVSTSMGSSIYCNWNGNFSIQVNSTLRNDGELYIDGEASLACDTVNNGNITAWNLYISGSFENNGKVMIYGDLIDYGNVFAGNAPIYME